MSETPTTLYKLVDPNHSAAAEIDTCHINYGRGIDYYTDENRKLLVYFNATINDSLRSRIPFIDIFRDVYHPRNGRESVLFWETLYERTRRAEFPGKPTRLDSYFAFATTKDAARFRKRSHGGHSMKAFETVNCTVLHVGDMEHLDRVTASMTAEEAVENVYLYWQGQPSGDPLYEYLVQGSLRLRDVDRSPLPPRGAA